MGIEVPAVLFDRLDARQIVELFVTINAKHTRLNPSHIVSLAGRKLYPGSEPGARPRRDPLAQRGRRPRRCTARSRCSAPAAAASPRRRSPRRSSTSSRRVEKLGGRRPHERDAPERQALLPELHEGRSPASSPPPGRAASTRSRPAPRCAPSSASPPTSMARAREPAPRRRSTCTPSATRSSRGASVLERPALRDRGRVEAQARGRHARHRRSAHTRAPRGAPALGVIGDSARRCAGAVTCRQSVGQERALPAGHAARPLVDTLTGHETSRSPSTTRRSHGPAGRAPLPDAAINQPPNGFHPTDSTAPPQGEHPNPN